MMGEYKKVVLPLDGSRFAEQALPFAFAMADQSGGELHLVHAHESLAPMYGISMAGIESTGTPATRSGEMEYLKSLAAKIGAIAKCRIGSTLLDGAPATAIPAFAKEIGAELMVLTTHGRGAFGRFWMGGTANRFVQSCHLPLLLVRPDSDVTPIDELLRIKPAVRRVVVPLDGSEFSELIEPALAGAFAAGQTELLLVRVVAPPPAFGDDVGSFGGYVVTGTDLPLLKHLENEAHDNLRRTADRLKNKYQRVETMVAIHPSVPAAILEEAGKFKADAIAMATHARYGVEKFFLGSVADKVIRGSHVPVLVIRP